MAGASQTLAQLLYWLFEHLKPYHLSSLDRGGFNQRVLGLPGETKQSLRMDRPRARQPLGCLSQKRQLRQAFKPQGRGRLTGLESSEVGQASGLVDPGAQGHLQ